ncbi:MAG TPA: hemolysin family protein, partial [Candidatus Polarisedimenticolaceae bacterium]|nr:hemolysin family protein [Candidatus Polarisedimenticolaceae bacterium]
MIEPATRLIDVWPFAVAAVLLVIDLSLVIALSAMTALGPVSLRRFSSERMPHLAFVENLPRPDSAHKMAAHGLQQICLLGTMTLVAYALRLRGVATPALVAWLGTVLVMVLGLHMFVARGLAMWKPHRAFPVTLWSMRLAFVCLYPLVVAARAWIRRIAEVQARLEDERDEDQDEQVEALIEVGERSGLLEAEEGKMMRGIVDLDETLVREIMTPRTEIVAVEVGTTVDEARGRILDSGHSRLPVYRETIDNVVGVLHSRDLFQAWKAGEDDRAVAHYLRPAVFVPETLSAAELLAEMRQRTQIALVVDEYGGVAGLITLEDVLEEIVGDIRDEHDSEE